MIYFRKKKSRFFLILLGVTLFFTSRSFSQNTKSDSLIQEYQLSTDDNIKLTLARKIINLSYDSDSSTFLKYANETLLLGEKLGDEFIKGKVYLSLGFFHSERDMIKALDYANKSLAIFSELDSLKQKSQAHTLIGTVYYYYGNLSKSFENYFESLKIDERLNLETNLASDYNNLANIYSDQKNTTKALEYYFKALEIDRKHKLTKLYSSVLMNISISYGDLDSISQRLRYGLMALDSTKKYNNRSDLARTLLNLGDIYVKGKKFDKAESCYAEAEVTIMNDGSNYYVNYLYSSKGELYQAKNELEKAIEYYQKSLEYAQKNGIQAIVKGNSFELSSIYKSLGKYKESLFYKDIYYKISDSINSIEKTKKITELELQYKFDKQMDVKSKEAESKQKILLLQRRIIAFSIAALVLAISLIILIIINYRSKQKSYQLLSEQNEQIQIQSDELRKQRDQLKHLDATKDKLYSIIAHDLKNPFSVIMGFTSLLVEQWNEIEDNKKIEYLDQLNKSANITFDLLQNLLEWARSQSGRLKINPECIEIRDCIDKALSNVADQARSKNISITNLVEPSLSIEADPNMIGTVLRNLLTNAIKFTYENGAVCISTINYTNNEVSLVIEDNGIGMNQETLNELFDIESQSAKHGTNNEHGTGLGLILCKEFIEKNRGRIEVESTLGVGTQFKVTLPLCL